MRRARPTPRLLVGTLAVAWMATACGTVLPSASPSAESSASRTPAPTPDRAAPSVLSTDPPSGSVIGTGEVVRVTFSEPVRGVDAARFQLTDADGAVVAAAVSMDATGRVASLTPAVGLTVATTYTARLAGAIRDDAGNLLPSFSWSFATAGDVAFAGGTYTGYRFGDSGAHLVAIRRDTLVGSSSGTAVAYEVVAGQGYLRMAGGEWDGYLVHGEPWGVAQDDQHAPILPLPACDYLDLPTARPDLADWATTVLDTVFQLPPGYAPTDFVSTADAGLGGGHIIRAVALDDLVALIDAATAEGVQLAVQSAYRSYAGQVLTFNGWVAEVGYAEALQTSARPGHSEHQLGTAIDFRSADGPAPWRLADWATTREGSWLAANGWRFGWVMSYPKGATAVSCYRYEPWHYRYVGREAAVTIHDAGISPREWLWGQGFGVR